jgi:DNA-binding transcriptional LysR family regulator
MESPVVDLRQLHAFATVADTLHFGRAAARLHIAQPALSQQIKRLETTLGVALLERTSRSVALTPAGVVLRDRTRLLLAQAARDVDEVRRVGAGELGTLDLGYVVSALPLGPVERVQRFRAAYPGVGVRMSEGYTEVLLDRIARGTLDLAILRDPDERDGIATAPFRRESFVAVVAADHDLAGRTSVRGADLIDEPFVFFPVEAGALAATRNLAPVTVDGRVPRVVQEATTWTTVLHLVRAGVGVTVAPESALITAPDGVVALPIAGTDAFSELVWAWRADDERPVLRAFVEGD